MRAQRPRRRQAGARREQPQDGQLPGTFHVERHSASSASATSWAAAAWATWSRPGVYSQPDRDEAVAIAADSSEPSRGVFRLSITEPMDEVAYLDHLRLDVVDRPPGVSTTPDERFAPSGPSAHRRGSRLANGHRARRRDRPRGPRHDRDPEALGPPHGRHLRQAARAGSATRRSTGSSSISATGSARFGPTDPLVLCLAGWVEYPYSQTNYAAATAGVALQPPAVERRRDDGTWQMIEPHAGYPAGLPRLMTLDLTGKLTGRPLCPADQDQHGMLLRPGLHRGARPPGRARRCASPRFPSPGRSWAIAVIPGRSRPTAGSLWSTIMTTSTRRRWPGCRAS